MKLINLKTKDVNNLSYLGELIDYCEVNNEEFEGINIHIGLSEAIKNFGESIIITNRIDETNYWFYSEDERKQEFREDLPQLINYLILDKILKINYKYIDPIIDGLLSVDKIVGVIPDNLNTLIIDNIIYSYSKKDNCIFGVDLTFIRYLNLDTIHLKALIINKSEVHTEIKPIVHINDLPNTYLVLFI